MLNEMKKQSRRNAVEAAQEAVARIRKNKDEGNMFIDIDDLAAIKAVAVHLSDERELTEKEIRLAQEILSLCKGEYSFGAGLSDKNRIVQVILNDKAYDALLAKVKEEGAEEPLPFVPKGFDRAEPADPTLVNVNMQRCYYIYDDEEPINGVKEKGTVEGFVNSIFEKAGVKKSKELTFMMAPKIDGIAMATSVKKGKFKLPTLKGDKNDQSVLVKSLIGYELDSPEWSSGNVQYEVFVTNETRKDLAEIFETEYKHNRTAAAGMVVRLAQGDLSDKKIKKVIKNLYFYPIWATDVDEKDPRKMIEEIDTMGHLPKDGMHKRKIVTGDAKEIIKEIKKYFEKLRDGRADLEYSVDGVVVTALDKEVIKAVGREKNANLYQFAVKFPPMTAKIKVKDVYLSVAGKKGERKPKVSFEPVNIDGRTFSEATLEYDDLKTLRIAKQDTLTLSIVGDVIPSVTREEGDEHSGLPVIDYFGYCPSCGTDFEITEGKKQLVCSNMYCPANKTGRIETALEVLGVEAGNKLSEKLMADKKGSSLLTPPSLVFDTLNQTEEEMQEKLGEKTGSKIYKQIQDGLKNYNEKDLIMMLGVRNLGDKTAKMLVSNFTMDELANGKKDDLELRIRKIEGYSVLSSINITAGLLQTREDLRKFMEHYPPKHKEYSTMTKLGSSKTKPDSEINELMEQLKWEYTDGKDFDILLVKDKDISTNKMKKAEDYKIPVYTRDELVEYMKSLIS